MSKVSKFSETPEVEAIPVSEDIVRYPGFMQFLYQKKLQGTKNLTKSVALDKEIEIWTLKEQQATEQLIKAVGTE